MVEDLTKNEESFNHLYDHYSRIQEQKEDFRNNNLTDLLLQYLKPGNVLDIGCGLGFFLLKAEKICTEAMGIEPNEDLTQLIKEIPSSSISIFNMWAQDISRINRTFDNITMIDVLEHIKEDEDQIRVVNNQLNPKGRFIVVVPAGKSLYGIRDKKMGHYRRYSKEELESKLISNGFKILSMRHWNMMGFLPYFIIEKIMHKELSSDIRSSNNGGPIKKVLKTFLDRWFKNIENNNDFHFGLSLIVVSEKG